MRASLPIAQVLTKQVGPVAVHVNQAACHLDQAPLPVWSVLPELRQSIYG